MINISKIQDALVGIVGYKQPFNPDYAIVDADNQLSESGYYITDNTFAKIEYIKDSQDYIDISDEDFNEVLKQIKLSAISSIVNQVFNEYDFLDRNLLYKNASNKADLETLPNGFVGYKIEVSNVKNIAFKINRVLLDFSGTGSLTLILWNTASKTPLKTKVVNITTDHQEVLLDWELDNSSGTYKGDYYIGYKTSGLTVSPYKRDLGNANVMSTFKYLCIEKVLVKDHNSNTLFDLRDVDGMSEDNGLNFDISVYDDYTDFTINNKLLFAKAIQLECYASCANIYLNTLRSNGNSTIAAEMYEKVLLALGGTGTYSNLKVIGIREQIVGEIGFIKKEIEKLRVGFNKKHQILVKTLN